MAPDGLNGVMAYQFEKPVLLRTDGDVQSISSVAEAVECLDRWPSQDSRKSDKTRSRFARW